jgi:murein DD-endopeptidase MepM/ murein hydrolase activator NlpD
MPPSLSPASPCHALLSRHWDRLYLSPIYRTTWSLTGGNNHAGVDFRCAANAGVYAISDGIVRFTETRSNRWGSLSSVRIEQVTAEGTRFLAIYGHVEPAPTIVEGRRVIAGEQIGSIGLFGDINHLHFELNADLNRTNSYGYTDMAGGNQLAPVQYLVENSATIPMSELNAHKLSFWAATAITNCIQLGVFDQMWGMGMFPDDQIWYRANSPMSRGEFDQISRRCHGLVYPSPVAPPPPLSNPDSYLRLGEMVEIIRRRFELGDPSATATATFKDSVKRLAAANFQAPRDGSFTNYSRNPLRRNVSMWSNPWVPAVGIVDLRPKAHTESYVPTKRTGLGWHTLDSAAGEDGYGLPVTRALCAYVMNGLLQYRAHSPTGPVPLP